MFCFSYNNNNTCDRQEDKDGHDRFRVFIRFLDM